MKPNAKRFFVLAVAILLAIGMILPYASAAGRNDAPLGQVPEAVTDSLMPDGEVARHIASLLSADKPQTRNERLAAADPADITFGPPLRYAVVAADRWGEGETLTNDDLVDRDPTYVALVKDGTDPVDVVQIAPAGEFVALGGFTPQTLTDLADIQAGSIVLTEPALDAYFLVEPDLEHIRPLNAAASDLMGPEALTIADYRALSRPEPTTANGIEAAASAETGAAARTRVTESSPWLPTILVGLGVATVGIVAVALARSSRHVDL